MIEFRFLGANGSCQDADSGNTALLLNGTDGAVCVDLSCNIAAAVDADVDAVILTHEHIDHIYALPSLVHQLWLSGRTRALDIFVPAGMEELPETLMSVFGIRKKSGMFDIRISAPDHFRIGTLAISLFKTDHTHTSVGVIVQEGCDKLLYTCDTRPIQTVSEEMRGTNVLIHEASGSAADRVLLTKKGHSSAADAARLAEWLHVQRLYLCHLPRGIQQKNELLGEALQIFPNTFLPAILKAYCIPDGGVRQSDSSSSGIC